MGRPRKGRYFPGPKGRVLRITKRLEKLYYFRSRKPRGKAARSYEFTELLKERVPFVYVFVVDQVRKAKEEQNPAFQKIVAEWETATGLSKPSARELTAYVIERAFEGAWDRWGIIPPFRSGECDSLYRRYVHGHPGAIKIFRKVLREPQPWQRHHVGHELKWFLSSSGEAARHYRLLEESPLLIPILTIREV